MTLFAKKRIYLDYAASAPVCKEARTAFLTASTLYGNPSSPHEEGRVAKEALLKARSTIATYAGVKARNVIFTSGATEANNLAIRGFVQNKIAQGTSGAALHVLYLPSAHASLVSSVESLATLGVVVEPIPLANGILDLVALEKLLRPETVLVCVDAVCGETGTRFDVRGVRKVLDTRPQPISLHVDGSQLPLVESYDRLRLSADTLTLDAQKVGGVRGIGALIVGDPTHLSPSMYGGGQEEGLRPGTEAVALAASFAAALSTAAQEREAFVARAEHMRRELVETVLTNLPQVSVLESKKMAPHIVNLSCKGLDTDYGVMLLDAKGFSVSTKSACETENKGSRAVALLTGDIERSLSTLRVSWGHETTPKELRAFTTALIETIQYLEHQKNLLVVGS